MNKNPKIFVLCYPHFGLLDVWLPIVSRMNDIEKHLKFTLIIPNVTIVNALHKDNSLVRISDSILDTILIHVHGDMWIEHASIFDTIDWYQKNRFILRLLDILWRLSDKHLFFYILTRPLVFLLRNKIYINEFKSKNLNNYVSKMDILLYDIHTEKNSMVLDILPLFDKNNNNKYSLLHGMDMRGADEVYPKRISVNQNNIKLYAVSEIQQKYYEALYGFDKNKVHIVGIPRHDNKWINKMQKYSPELPKNFDKKTVLILTVPMHRFSYEHRIRALKDIKDIFIDKLKMKVVIKLHPNEKKKKIFYNKRENIYEKIFGLSNYELTWIYSDMHIFALGKDKELVISLGSGVVFDLIVIGTPCIEYTSFKSKPSDFDKHKTGYENHLTDYVKYGFVEAVSNYHELNTYVEKYIENSNQISTASKKAYDKYFPVFNDSSGIVATEILQDNNIIDCR